jgi:hypothetical protein
MGELVTLYRIPTEITQNTLCKSSVFVPYNGFCLFCCYLKENNKARKH